MEPTDYHAPGRQLDTSRGAQFEALDLIDGGSFALADLPQLFREQHPRVLASAWAALLLDSLIDAGLMRIGDTARAFNVVALKLNHRPPQRQRPSKKAA